MGKSVAGDMARAHRRNLKVRDPLAWFRRADLCLVSDESLGAAPDENSSTAEPSAADAAERAEEDAERAKEDLVLARQWEAVVRKCVKSMTESERKDWLREQAEQERFENGSRFGQDSLWEDYSTAGHEYHE